MLRERLVPVLALGGAVAALPPALLHSFGSRTVYLGGMTHFAGVGLTALAATAAAVALTAAGARRRDRRVVLAGTAFAIMASLLALHGLATPGILVGSNGVVAFTGGATLPAGGAVLALSALPALRRPGSVRPLLALQGAALAGVLVLGGFALFLPELMPPVPEPNSPAAMAALTAGLAFFALLALRALRTYLLTRRSSDLVVAVGVVWLGAALVPALTQSYWHLGWWLGHAFELAGIALVATPVALDFRRAAQSRPLLGDFCAAELVAQEEAFLGSHVRALTVRLAEKDEYTEEHTRRVALRAVQVGEELRLSASRLRALAIGGLLHDIGKLGVPDAILKKPASLDEREYGVVCRHPEWGLRLLRDLGGFSDAVCRLVLDHHERLDGSGYPRGLKGSELDLDTRILAVCDVYDALISPRVYRGAWTHEEAIRLLERHAGDLFDERCVQALERVLAQEGLERALRAPATSVATATAPTSA